MKWIQLFIVVTSLSIHATGQNLEQAFALAQEQYNSGNLSLAEKTYRRVLFFDSANIFRGEVAEKLAYISLANDDLQAALNYFDQAYFSISNLEHKTDIQFERIQLFIKRKEFQKALAEIYQVEVTETVNQRLSLYEGYCHYLLKDFQSAEVAFTSLVRDTAAIVHISEMMDRARKIERMNPKTYQILSYFIPGLGQIVLGDARSSINSIFLNSALALLFIETAKKLSLFDATLSVIPWFYRYYAGGAKLTKDLAIAKKQRRHEENLGELITSLIESSQ